MKVFLTLAVILFPAESANYFVDDESNSPNYCRFDQPKNLICNFTEYKEDVVIRSRNNSFNLDNLTIHNALEVQIDEVFCCVKEVFIYNSKGIFSSNNSPPFKLYLYHSSAIITNKGYSYLKVENSTIDEIYLQNIGEFDITNSYVKTLSIDAFEKTPSIINSTIDNLNIELTNNSLMRISNSKIQKINKFIVKSSKITNISESNIGEVMQNGISIQEGAKMLFKDVEINILSPKSIHVEKGELTFDNVSLKVNPDLNSIIMKNQGKFKVKSYVTNGNDTSIIAYTISDTSEDFSTLSVIAEYIKDNKWVYVLLGVFCALTSVVIICLMAYIFWNFKKGRELQETRKVPVESKDQIKNEKEKNLTNPDSQSISTTEYTDSLSFLPPSSLNVQPTSHHMDSTNNSALIFTKPLPFAHPIIPIDNKQGPEDYPTLDEPVEYFNLKEVDGYSEPEPGYNTENDVSNVHSVHTHNNKVGPIINKLDSNMSSSPKVPTKPKPGGQLLNPKITPNPSFLAKSPKPWKNVPAPNTDSSLPNHSLNWGTGAQHISPLLSPGPLSKVPPPRPKPFGSLANANQHAIQFPSNANPTHGIQFPQSQFSEQPDEYEEPMYEEPDVR